MFQRQHSFSGQALQDVIKFVSKEQELELFKQQLKQFK